MSVAPVSLPTARRGGGVDLAGALQVLLAEHAIELGALDDAHAAERLQIAGDGLADGLADRRLAARQDRGTAAPPPSAPRPTPWSRRRRDRAAGPASRRRIAEDCIRSSRHDLLADRDRRVRSSADARLGRARFVGQGRRPRARHGGAEPQGARPGRAARRRAGAGAAAAVRHPRDGPRRRRLSRLSDPRRGARRRRAGPSPRRRAAAGGVGRPGAPARADERKPVHERQERRPHRAPDARRARHRAASHDAAQKINREIQQIQGED